MYAQYMVSTTPSNRNVLIEDLTGIFCGYCPDGAKVADNIHNSAPDRSVIIGNHAGSYASPGSAASSQWDFRTNEGTQINGLSDPSGYPAGNINRRVTPNSMKPGKTAMSRGSWGAEAGNTMAMASPLNLAVDAYYRPGTSTIEIIVEGYYTSAGNGSDYLTVAILQDNILSYQSGSSGYPARVDPSTGLYRQMDVLRAYATTSVLGDEISTTDAGTFFIKNYSYAVAKVGPDITPVLDDMKVAVWMTEEMTWSEVITVAALGGGAGGHVGARAVGINEATSLEGLQIYPNPFATTATIEFELQDSENIQINIFDVTGKTVQSIPNQMYSVGNHKINVDGNGLENGLYYVNIVAEDGIITRRLVLNK
jgi:hypothetical protein